jgi:hypothetical protein
MKIQIEKTTKKSKTAKKTAPVPCYTRDDIESILVTVMLTATAIASVLLTLTLFISVLKH